MYNIGNLVNALSCIVGFCIFIFRAEMTPLESVNGAQVADFTVSQTQIVEEFTGPIAVPDFYTEFIERDGRCVTLDEPEEFGDDGAEKDSLRCEQR